MNPIEKQPTQKPESPKKAYSGPQLQIYGSLQEITKSNQPHSGVDAINMNHGFTR
jgi:hypothetical protein